MVKKLQQIVLLLDGMIRFGMKFPEICSEQAINSVELSSQIYIKNKKLVFLLKKQQFPIDYREKNSVELMRKLIIRCYLF